NVVSIAISSDGSACTDDAAPFGNITKAGKFGLVSLMRTNIAVSGSTQPVTMDWLNASFRKEVGGDFAYNSAFSIPPRGSCTSLSMSGNTLSVNNLLGFAPGGGVLNAGTVSASNSAVKRSAHSDPYYALLGSSVALTGSGPFLDNGPFTIAGTGG